MTSAVGLAGADNQIGEVLYTFAGVSSQIEDMDEDSDASQYPTCTYS